MAGRNFGGKKFWREEILAGRNFGGKKFWREEILAGRNFGGKKFRIDSSVLLKCFGLTPSDKECYALPLILEYCTDTAVLPLA